MKYVYALGTRALAQNSEAWEYLLPDALGSVRQIVDADGNVTLAESYEPYGSVLSSTGTASSIFGYSGEQVDTSGLVYLRARYMQPRLGIFLARDPWSGDQMRPGSMNGYSYGLGNPVKYTDPSGRDPWWSCEERLGYEACYGKQYDLTGYLAAAMTKHGQDPRIKLIADTIKKRQAEEALGPKYWCSPYDMASGVWHISAPPLPGWSPTEFSYVNDYLPFFELEAAYKEWDIKRNIEREIGHGIVLCGETCDWYDYSTPGNIHFGYVAEIAEIDQHIAAIAGGVLEQKDKWDEERQLHLEYCREFFECDDPQDQAAVDFGYDLARRYPNGISEASLRRELTQGRTSQFQRPVDPSFHPSTPAVTQPNHYGADYFNYP